MSKQTAAKAVAFMSLLLATPALPQEQNHDHPAPERLGTVRFETSCAPSEAAAFDRAIALLHSFAYAAADEGFAGIATREPGCAMAHWGRAMAHYHQLWEPASAGAALAAGTAEIESAAAITAVTPRERELIAALRSYYAGADLAGPAARAQRYSDAMARVAQQFPDDDEVQIFYALSLIATAPPTERTHDRQKRAADILEPIWQRQPDHPGVPHYLIHAYDSAELAQRGLAAARAYAGIASSAPHALHMPSHIFTRLGLWEDSIRSNIASRAAAREQGDIGEELHAMDYLTYAYLQGGDTAEAAQLVASVDREALDASGFKISYAGNAMAVRLAVESKNWAEAAGMSPLPGSPPHVAAIVWWAKALGQLRSSPPSSAAAAIAELEASRDALRTAGNAYWAQQTDALLKSAQGWQAAAEGNSARALVDLTAAAELEEALEKLPVTPGPIVPAREQLGEALLQFGKPGEALAAFEAALVHAPGRRGALAGAEEARRRLGGR